MEVLVQADQVEVLVQVAYKEIQVLQVQADQVVQAEDRDQVEVLDQAVKAEVLVQAEVLVLSLIHI